MFAALKKLFARTTADRSTPPRIASLAVESLEAREVPAGLSTIDYVPSITADAPDDSIEAMVKTGYDLKLNKKL
jgi:hypothetical protein